MPKYDSIDYPVEQIREWIAEGKTQQWIASKLAASLDPRVTPKLIYKVCKKHQIACQRTGPRAAEGHPNWDGGKIQAKHGYVKVYKPDHPDCLRVTANRLAKSSGGYVRKQVYIWEHRLVMEQHLGRHLLPGEVVHHINGVKNDNRIENLQLFATNAEHLAHDLAGRCPKWSEDGKQRIRAAVRQRHANRQESEACAAK